MYRQFNKEDITKLLYVRFIHEYNIGHPKFGCPQEEWDNQGCVEYQSSMSSLLYLTLFLILY